MQLKFLGVLIGGHVRKPRRIIGRANFLKCFGLHGDSHNDGGPEGLCFVIAGDSSVLQSILGLPGSVSSRNSGSETQRLSSGVQRLTPAR